MARDRHHTVILYIFFLILSISILYRTSGCDPQGLKRTVAGGKKEEFFLQMSASCLSLLSLIRLLNVLNIGLSLLSHHKRGDMGRYVLRTPTVADGGGTFTVW